jgi:hypothetical protein
MLPNHHPCINTNKHKSFSGVFHHLVEKRTNIKKGIIKKCQVAILEGLDVNK